MGLACAPFIFTKILVPLFTQLRGDGKRCFCYLDDIFITGNSELECTHTTNLTKTKLRELGFKIHEEKSQCIPTKEVKFLGFMINLEEMQAYLPEDKIEKVVKTCTNALAKGKGTIQEISSVVGLLNSYAKAMDYGDNYIKRVEIDKIRALQASRGNFDVQMEISRKGKQDLLWWLNNANKGVREFSSRSPSHTLITDASNVGWGAVWGDAKAQGKWSE